MSGGSAAGPSPDPSNRPSLLRAVSKGASVRPVPILTPRLIMPLSLTRVSPSHHNLIPLLMYPSTGCLHVCPNTNWVRPWSPDIDTTPILRLQRHIHRRIILNLSAEQTARYPHRGRSRRNHQEFYPRRFFCRHERPGSHRSKTTRQTYLGGGRPRPFQHHGILVLACCPASYCILLALCYSNDCVHYTWSRRLSTCNSATRQTQPD